MTIRTISSPPKNIATILKPGDQVGRYQVCRSLRVKAGKQLYQVRHQTLDSDYALLVLEGLDRGERERVERLGRQQSRLIHPNIVRVHDVLEVQGRAALLMDYVDGISLEEHLHGEELSRWEWLQLSRQVLDALEYAHSQGVYHGALRRAKVLFTRRGSQIVAKVTGLGLSPGFSDAEEGDAERVAISDRGALVELFSRTCPDLFEELVEDSGPASAPLSLKELRERLEQAEQEGLGEREEELAPAIRARKPKRGWFGMGLLTLVLVGGAAGLFFRGDGQEESLEALVGVEPPEETEMSSRVALSADGSREALINASGVVVIHEVETSRELSRFSSRIGGGAVEGFFSPNGALLILFPGRWTEGEMPERSAPARVFAVETGTLVHSFSHGSRTTAVVVSPSGQWAATTGEDHRVILWDMFTGAPDRRFEADKEAMRVACLGFAPQSSELVVVYEDGEEEGWISIYDRQEEGAEDWRERRQELPEEYAFSGRCELRSGAGTEFEVHRFNGK